MAENKSEEAKKNRGAKLLLRGCFPHLQVVLYYLSSVEEEKV